LIRKATGVPATLITSPATAVPAIRARLNTALFSAMAFGTASLPTISAANACLAGLSTAVIIPRANASRYTCQIRAVPVRTG